MTHKIVDIIYNEFTDKVILSPNNKRLRREYDNIAFLLQDLDPKRKIIIRTNFPELFEGKNYKNIERIEELK